WPPSSRYRASTMLWAQVEWLLSRKISDASRLSVAVHAVGRTRRVTRAPCRARRAAARRRHGGRRGTHPASVIGAAARPRSEQSPADLGAAEGAVEPRAVAPLCHGDRRAHRALQPARFRSDRHATARCRGPRWLRGPPRLLRDRKSTRLNSSHVKISYAVFCLKKKL